MFYLLLPAVTENLCLISFNLCVLLVCGCTFLKQRMSEDLRKKNINCAQGHDSLCLHNEEKNCTLYGHKEMLLFLSVDRNLVSCIDPFANVLTFF